MEEQKQSAFAALALSFGHVSLKEKIAFIENLQIMIHSKMWRYSPID
jgi:hypothetical protein